MTTPEAHMQKTRIPAEIRQMLARARPEQIARLMADITAKAQTEARQDA